MPKKKKIREKPKETLKRKFYAALELPKEIMMNLPLLTLIGNEELLIENYKGVIEYTTERIRISTSSGLLRVDGKSLWLRQITNDSIAVTGNVTKLEYLL